MQLNMNPEELYKYLQRNKLAGGPISVTENSRIEQRIIDSFSDPKSFLYELIQNADDAAINDNVTIKIIATKDYICLAHNGSPFTQEDVMALCTIGALRKDQKSKSQDKSKIGYKGVGFKSVFKISEEVTIFSGKYKFQFDQKYWETNGIDASKELGWNEDCIQKWNEHCEHGQLVNKIEFPWRTIPIPVSEEVPNGFENFSVITRIKLNDYIKRVDFEGELNELLGNSNVILFLNSNNITIETDDIIFSKELKNEVLTITNGSNKEEWRLFSSTMEVVKEDLPFSAPPKMEELKEIGITLAINLKDGLVYPLKKQPCDIFSFLPTKESFGLPFLVNSQFVLDNSREHLATNDKWNERIFESFGLLLASTLEELSKDEDSKTQVFNLIPSNKELNRYQEILYGNFESQLVHKAFIPVFDSDVPKSINEVIIDKTGLSEVDELRPLVKKLLSAESKYIVYNADLKGLNKIENFNVESLHKDNITSLFEQEEIQLFLKEQDKEYFVSLIKGFKDSKLTINTIKEIPFLKTNKGEVSSSQELFLSIKGEDVCNDLSLEFLFVDIVDSCSFKKELFNWIQNDLKVKYPSPNEIVSNYSIRNKANEDKAINQALIRYIYNRKNEITSWDNVQRIQLITKDNNFVNSNSLYFADKYEPRLRLENELRRDSLILSEDYIDSDEIQRWRVFFEDRFNVIDKLEAKRITLNRRSWGAGNYTHLVSVKGYILDDYVKYALDRFEQTKEKIGTDLFGDGKKNVKDYLKDFSFISNMPLLVNSKRKFSVLFWESFFKNFENNYDGIQTSLEEKPSFGVYGSSNRTYLKNFSTWIIENYDIYPVTNNEFSNKKIKEVLIPSKENLLFKDFLSVSEIEIPLSILEYKIDEEQVFKFREAPTDEEMIEILSCLKSDTKNVKTLVERIYNQLLKSSQSFVKEAVSKLLTQDEDFVPKEDVVFIQDRALRKKLKLDNHMYIPRGIIEEADELQLAKILGVDKISSDTIKSSEALKDENFSSYFKEKEKLFRCIISEEEELSNLSNLEVIAHNGIEFEIKGQLRSISAIIMPLSENGAILHIDNSWQNKRTIRRDISEEINKYLNIENQLLVDDILWSCPLEVIESMENDGFEVNDDVKDYYKNLQSKESNSSFQKTSSLPHIEKDISIENGIRAEEKVFKKLIETYRITKANCHPIFEEKYLFETEEIKIQWQRGYDDKKDHDILLIQKNNGSSKSYFIEVKSTVNPKFNRNGESLYFSDLEWNKLRQSKLRNEDYYLAVVFNNKETILDDDDLHIVKMIPQYDNKRLADLFTKQQEPITID